MEWAAKRLAWRVPKTFLLQGMCDLSILMCFMSVNLVCYQQNKRELWLPLLMIRVIISFMCGVLR